MTKGQLTAIVARAQDRAGRVYRTANLKEKTMRQLLLATSGLFLLVSCASSPPPAKVVVDQNQPAQALFEKYFAADLVLNPSRATQIGDHSMDDRLPNFLAQSQRDAEDKLVRETIVAARDIDPATLDDANKISYAMFVRTLKIEQEAEKFPGYLMPLNQFYNFVNGWAVSGAGTGPQPFKTVKDYQNWLSRMQQMPAIIDQAIANMREGMRSGITQPKALMGKVVEQLDAHLDADLSKNVFTAPVRNFPAEINTAEQQILAADYNKMVSGSLQPAIRRLRQFVQDEYLPACRTTSGMGALPGGAGWYAFLIRRQTTTDLTAEQIHQIGLDEVARIQNEMRKLMPKLGLRGDLPELYAAAKNDPRFYFKDRDELLRAYNDFRAIVEPKIAKLFDIAPKTDFEIRPVESFREKAASSGQYNGPDAEGTRKGIFYVNTFDLKARPRSALESLFLHEAIPGHHFQIALQTEQKSLPRFRRFGGETAFAEGWGLYAESLGKELGVYTDPVMEYGALEAELWRSIRLVLDTGLHAKGWTREQAIAYAGENSAVDNTRAVSEVERFMAIPGQALAYKIGQLKIRELRTMAEEKMGARFDVKGFHHQVLIDGAMPLAVLEDKIKRWAAQN
jgi:uncharacterized protein (DUF885 family)